MHYKIERLEGSALEGSLEIDALSARPYAESHLTAVDGPDHPCSVRRLLEGQPT